MAVGDFYELTHFQELRGQQVLNVYHYEQTAGIAGGAPQLLAGWIFSQLPLIAAIQADDVTYTRILAQNLITETDNAESLTPTPASGAITDVPVPLRLAMAFRSQRPDLSKRYSWKRYAGIASSILSGFQFNALHAGVVALANGLDTVVTSGANSFKPVQLRLVDPATGNPVVQKRYDITGNWTALAEPATQDSRAFGRGA